MSRQFEVNSSVFIPIDFLIQDAIIAIKERDDFTLLSLLISGGSLSFSEIQEYFNMNPSELNRTLDRLMNGSLINNYYAKKNDSNKHSFYEATTFAKRLFDKLRELQTVKRENIMGENLFYRPGSLIGTISRELGFLGSRGCGFSSNERTMSANLNETL